MRICPSSITRRRSRLDRDLPDDGPEDRLAQKLPDLVLDRRDGLRPVLGFPGGELLLPEGADHRIVDMPRKVFAVLRVAEQPLEREQRRAGHFQQGQQGVAEDVLQPRAPTVAVELLERGDDGGGDERPLVRLSAGEQVEREGIVSVAGVEEDHVVRAVAGDRRRGSLRRGRRGDR